MKLKKNQITVWEYFKENHEDSTGLLSIMGIASAIIFIVKILSGKLDELSAVDVIVQAILFAATPVIIYEVLILIETLITGAVVSVIKSMGK